LRFPNNLGAIGALCLMRTLHKSSLFPEVEKGVAMKRRILLAEDSEQTRQSLKDLLEADEQIQVETAQDGEKAIKALTQRNYSIFVTDLKMPGLDGMRLIEEIQKQKIPVTIIVMTGYGSINEAVQAMRLGAYGFLTKPIDVQHLRVVINRALRD